MPPPQSSRSLFPAQSRRQHDDENRSYDGETPAFRSQMAEEQAPTPQMLPVYPVDNDDLVHKVGMRGEIGDRPYLCGRHVEHFGKQVRGRLGLISSGQIMMDAIKRQVRAYGPSDSVGKPC